MSLEKYKAKLEEWKKVREAGTPAPIVIGTKMTEADWDFCILAVNNWTELIDAHLNAVEELISAKNHARHIIEMAQKDGWTSNELEFGCSLLEINIEKTLSQITESK